MMNDESHKSPLGCITEGRNDTHLEFLVSLQNLRAQREVMHRALVIVINDITFPILALVRGLCASLTLSFTRGWGARRLC